MNDLSGNPLFDTPVMRKLTDVLGTLKPAQRKVGEFILRNPLRAAMLSISEIGRESDTSPAAVNRLGNQLGMNGFTGLRMALVNHLLSVVSPHLLLSQEQQGLDFSLACHLQKIHAGAAHVSQHNAQHVFDAALNALCGARRLFIMGGSRCYPLAQMVEQHMIPYSPACLAISLNGGVELAARRLSHLDESDTVMVLSLPPYNQYAITLATLAQQTGAQVIAVTDSPASPLAGTHTLYAPNDLPGGDASLAPAFALVDALMAGVRFKLDHERPALALASWDTARSA